MIPIISALFIPKKKNQKKANIQVAPSPLIENVYLQAELICWMTYFITQSNVQEMIFYC